MKLILLLCLFVFFLSSLECAFVTRQGLWEHILKSSRPESSSIASRIIQEVKGNCPYVGKSGARDRAEALDLCISMLTKISEYCKNPSIQATYIFMEGQGLSMKLLGSRTTSKKEVKSLIEKFCRIISSDFDLLGSNVSSSSSSSSSSESKPSLPPVVSPSVVPQPPILTPTKSPSHVEEWKHIVNSASFGSGNKYISSIPSIAFPKFKLGKDLDEKVEQCIKALRGMVKASVEEKSSYYKDKKAVYTVTALSENGRQIKENLVILIEENDTSLIKEAIKKFCETTYGTLEEEKQSSEWRKIYEFSIKNSIIQNLPQSAPLGFTVTSHNSQELMNSCKESISSFVKNGKKRRGKTNFKRSKVKVELIFAGNYLDKHHSQKAFEIRLICNQPCDEEQIGATISKFCRKLYWKPLKELDYEKKKVLEELYEKIQSINLQENGLFSNFPQSAPLFLNTDNFKFELDGNKASTQTYVDLCEKFIQFCWKKSHTKSPSIKSKPSVIPGISSNYIIKVGIDWGGSTGTVFIEFPFIDLETDPSLNFDKVTQKFCTDLFSPSPQPITPHEPTHPLSVEKYVGRRPPISFPQFVSEKSTLKTEVSGLTLTYSRSLWKKLYHHSNFGSGSTLIKGIGDKRPIEFLTTGTEESIFTNCYNSIVNLYNKGTEYRLSNDESRLRVKKMISVDAGKEGNKVLPETQICTLDFMLPKISNTESTLRMFSKLLEEFCRSFVDIVLR